MSSYQEIIFYSYSDRIPLNSCNDQLFYVILQLQFYTICIAPYNNLFRVVVNVFFHLSSFNAFHDFIKDLKNNLIRYRFIDLYNYI